MISYLIYTTICTGFVLLFYHLVLAKEKMYQINRWYLLLGLVFSLVIPFLPVGMSGSLLNPGSAGETSIVLNSLRTISIDTDLSQSAGIAEDASGKYPSLMEGSYSFLFYLYGIVTLFLLMRMGWQLYQMRKKALKNPASFFEDHKVVLLKEEVVPHTFGKTIFVNKRQFYEGDISTEMLLHELTHAKENHSLDIVFIELVKTIYWFNPVLYFYKRAMQMNHEFIADHTVLSRNADITEYQNVLLSLSKRKPTGSLSTNLNFNVTKKRFKMMTSHTSTYRSVLKSVLIIPFFAILGFTLGCEPASMKKDTQPRTVNIEFLGYETIKVDGKTIPLSQFSSAFSNLSIDPNKVIVNMKVQEGASMGAVTGVQTILRQQGALKINYSKDSSGDADPEVNKIQSIKERNILTLYITGEGKILVDQSPTQLSSVNKVVEEFLTNNGESSALSESPKDAIVSFKTDQQTPHDLFTRTLEKVLSVYRELRNQESMNLFGKPYTELEEGSKQQEKIKDIYPKKISIREPSNS